MSCANRSSANWRHKERPCRGECPDRVGAISSPAAPLRLCSHKAAEPLNTSAKHFFAGPLPPVGCGEYFHLDVSAITGVLHHRTDAVEINDTITHHAAVEQQIAGGDQPITDVIRQNAVGRSG